MAVICQFNVNHNLFLYTILMALGDILILWYIIPLTHIDYLGLSRVYCQQRKSDLFHPSQHRSSIKLFIICPCIAV